MKKRLPRFSVVIPVKPEGKIVAAIAALKKVDYPNNLLEIIIARGYSPSRQRNTAVKQAKGEIIYFLDSDSEINSKAFKRVAAAFSGKKIGSRAPVHDFSILPRFFCVWIDQKFFSGTKQTAREIPKIAAVGGPNIWTRKESFWSSAAGIVFESFFAYYTMVSRFRPTGDFRLCHERELVLCNLAIKRRIFNRIGGLKEELYPNEENELLNRLVKFGYKLIYHPGIYVVRPRRESFWAIEKMFLNYGRGRMEHIRISSINQSWLYLLPLLLLFYLICLILYHNWRLGFFPLAIYLLAGFGSALGFAARRKKIYLAVFLPFFFLICHLSYSLGLVIGLFTDLKKRKKIRGNQVELRWVKSFTRWQNGG